MLAAPLPLWFLHPQHRHQSPGCSFIKPSFISRDSLWSSFLTQTFPTLSFDPLSLALSISHRPSCIQLSFCPSLSSCPAQRRWSAVSFSQSEVWKPKIGPLHPSASLSSCPAVCYSLGCWSAGNFRQSWVRKPTFWPPFLKVDGSPAVRTSCCEVPRSASNPTAPRMFGWWFFRCLLLEVFWGLLCNQPLLYQAQSYMICLCSEHFELGWPVHSKIMNDMSWIQGQWVFFIFLPSLCLAAL